MYRIQYKKGELWFIAVYSDYLGLSPSEEDLLLEFPRLDLAEGFVTEIRSKKNKLRNLDLRIIKRVSTNGNIHSIVVKEYLL